MKILNDEQILELCLIAISVNPEMVDSFPGEFLCYYVIKSCGREGMTSDEIAITMNELIAGHELNSLVNKGYLEADFDDNGVTEYTRTELELPEL